MTQADVDVVTRGYDAVNRGDVEGLVALTDPEVVWEEGGVVFPDLPPAYHGHEGVRRWFKDALVEAWESFNAELLEIRDEGDGRVVQELRIRGRGRASGVEVDMRLAQTATIRNGLIVRRSIAPT